MSSIRSAEEVKPGEAPKDAEDLGIGPQANMEGMQMPT